MCVTATVAYADGPALDNLTKKEVEEIANEVSVNFSHTAVSAPSTDGLWGIEVGLIAGSSSSPNLADRVDEAGEDGDDFERIPHAGLMLRAHFPLDLFAEVSFLPTTKASDLEIQSRGVAVGWNAGGFFSWPLDVAIAAQVSNNELEFDQVIDNASTGNVPVDSTIKFKSRSTTVWLGVSKKFVFVTPYLKLGVHRSESDVEVDASAGDIFADSTSQKENVSNSGGYGAIGVNFHLLVMNFGLEASRTAEVPKISGKFSLSF